MPSTPDLPVPTGPDAQLRAEHLSVTRGGRTVLQDLSLTLTTRSRLAVVGENGRGKTTLLHVLAGLLAPDAGTLHRTGTLGLARQEMPVEDGATVGTLTRAAAASAVRAVEDLDRAAAELAAGDAGAADRYADALDRAPGSTPGTPDGGWTSHSRHSARAPTATASSPPCRWASATGCGWPACSAPGTTCCCWTNPPTTSTPTAWRSSPPGCARPTAGGRWSATTAPCSPTPRRPSSTWTPAGTAPPPCTPAATPTGRRAGAATTTGVDAGARRPGGRAPAAGRRGRPGPGPAVHRLAAGQGHRQAPAPVARTRRGAGPAAGPGSARRAPGHRSPAPGAAAFPELTPRPGAPLLHAEGVTVPGRLAGPVDVALAAGDRLVVTGGNGAGKSTLLAVLAGRLAPTSGSVRRPGRVGLLAQESDRSPAGRTAHQVLDGAPAAGLLDAEALRTRSSACPRGSGGGWTSPSGWNATGPAAARRTDQPPVGRPRRRADGRAAHHRGRGRGRHPRPAAAARPRRLAAPAPRSRRPAGRRRPATRVG